MILQEKEEGIGGTYDAYLVCAHCGHEWTLIHRVESFNRNEDAKEGQHVITHTGNITTTIDASMEGNPSSRRDAVIVTLWCEGCDKHTAIHIVQHKGITYCGSVAC